MSKLLVICGPTAAGKTALAVNLAKEFNGELISADSRQVFKGMDIGTGKDNQKSKIKNQKSKIQIENQKYLYPRLTSDIPTWLQDLVVPDKQFNVADYEKLATLVINDIQNRGKLPVIVGGTGLYIKAVIDGIGTANIPPNEELRCELEKYSVAKLQLKLREINPEKWEAMNNSDRNNPRRLVRALEISKSAGMISPSNKKNLPVKKKFDTLIIGLNMPNDLLFKKIDDRVEKRVKQGIIEEIKSLLKKGYGWDLPSMSGMGYRVWQGYFDGKKTLAGTVQRWKFDEHDYARRQSTWFKKDKRIIWLNNEINPFPKAKNLVSPWLKS